MATTKNKNSTMVQAQAMISGVKKHFSRVPSFTFEGQSYTPTEVEDALQGLVDATLAASQARAAWLDAVQHLRDTRSTANPIAKGIRSLARLQFGAQVALDDFGIVPRKRKTPTTQTKANAVQKAKVTRALTGVSGPKQRKAKVAAAKDTVLMAAPPPKNA